MASRSKSLFQQAPILDQRVTSGLLPSVDQRLPDNPLVIHPAHQMGPYGGTWPRYGTSPSDVGIFHHRLNSTMVWSAGIQWDARYYPTQRLTGI